MILDSGAQICRDSRQKLLKSRTAALTCMSYNASNHKAETVDVQYNQTLWVTLLLVTREHPLSISIPQAAPKIPALPDSTQKGLVLYQPLKGGRISQDFHESIQLPQVRGLSIQIKDKIGSNPCCLEKVQCARKTCKLKRKRS